MGRGRTACCGLSFCRILLEELADLEKRLGGLHGAGEGHREAEGEAAGVRACEVAQGQASRCSQCDSSSRSRIKEQSGWSEEEASREVRRGCRPPLTATSLFRSFRADRASSKLSKPCTGSNGGRSDVAVSSTFITSSLRIGEVRSAGSGRPSSL